MQYYRQVINSPCPLRSEWFHWLYVNKEEQVRYFIANLVCWLVDISMPFCKNKLFKPSLKLTVIFANFL